MKYNTFKSLFLFSFAMLLVIPACVQAFPINGLMIANSMTFTTYTVTIMGTTPNPANAYSPDTVTIQSGDTVIWAFANGTHSSTCGCDSPCGLWDTGTHGSGFSTPVPYTSFAVGTNGYYCTIHGCSEMYGAVILSPSTPVNLSNFQTLGALDNSKSVEQTAALKASFGITFVRSDDNKPLAKADTTQIQKQ